MPDPLDSSPPPPASIRTGEVALLRQRNAAAFTRLVQQCQGVVLSLGQSLGLKGTDLDDAAAEVFVEVYRSLPAFKGEAQVTTWVYAIAYRTMLRVRTKLGKQAVATPPEGVKGEAADTHILAPGDEAQQEEEYEKLWQAVAELEPQQALAIELFYGKGLSVTELVKVMNCPEGTIKTLLFRGRQRLREVLIRQEVTR
ncbi:MAG: sigma-70 family RNA polymerase sigma factor [Phycisphaerae bacterium]